MKVTVRRALPLKHRASKAGTKEPRSAKTSRARERAKVVELAANPRHVVALPDGSFAVAAGTKVVFVAPTAEILGEVECRTGELDMFEFGITSLAAVDDGRVVAFQRMASEARIARLGDEVARLVLPGERRTDTLSGGAGTSRAFVLAISQSAALVDLDTHAVREIEPWPDDYVRGAMPWRDGLVVWTTSRLAAFDAKGKRRFEVEGNDPIALDAGLLVNRERTAAIVGDDGSDVRVFDVGSLGHAGSSEAYRPARVVRDGALVLATCWPSAVAEWDLASGGCKWRVSPIHSASPGGLVATSKIVATWAPPPHHTKKDLTIAIFAGGREHARFSAKAPVLGVVALGEDAIAARFEGRTFGGAIGVWRDVAGHPTHETFTGHAGRVLGLLPLPNGRLLSWADDRTIRFWD